VVAHGRGEQLDRAAAQVLLTEIQRQLSDEGTRLTLSWSISERSFHG
jgi:hypothetical protein